MKDQTSTLLLTPWASAALSLADEQEIARRLVDLHARASVVKGNLGWTVRVASWAHRTTAPNGPVHSLAKHHQRGRLADVIAHVLDQYEREYVFTPDELAQIQRQGAA